MLTGRMVSTLLNSPGLLRPSIELYPGQIVRGQIIKHLPEQQALVQIGNLKVIAQMENDLTPGEGAWLQVQQAGHPAVLKILRTRDRSSTGKTSNDGFSALTESLSIDDTPENRKILNRLVDERLPIHSKDINQIKDMIQSRGVSLDMVIFALRKGMPLSIEGIDSLQQFFNGIQNPEIGQGLLNKLGSMLASFGTNIDSTSELSSIVTKALQLIREMEGLDFRWPSGNQIQHLLRSLDQLNEQLLYLQKNLNIPNENDQNHLDRIIQYITGQQLMLSPTVAPLQQWIIDLPLADGQQGFVQIESKKEPSGQIDPDNCRMLFYLDLNALGNLVVDLLITKKFVTLNLRGDHPELGDMIEMYRNELAAGLKDVGYLLTGIKRGTTPPQLHQKSPQEIAKPYIGVDFRI
jgi:hypothetical protein